jgi:hypothetical protein
MAIPHGCWPLSLSVESLVLREMVPDLMPWVLCAQVFGCLLFNARRRGHSQVFLGPQTSPGLQGTDQQPTTSRSVRGARSDLYFIHLRQALPALNAGSLTGICEGK